MGAKKPIEPYSSAEARTCCPPKPDLRARPLLTVGQAGKLARIFKVLANDTRLRLLHALTRAGQMYVTELAESVGMRAQAVSNQLQRLLDMGILACERNGNNMCYRIADPCVISLLDQGLCLMEEAGKSRHGRKRSSKNELSVV